VVSGVLRFPLRATGVASIRDSRPSMPTGDFEFASVNGQQRGTIVSRRYRGDRAFRIVIIRYPLRYRVAGKSWCTVAVPAMNQPSAVWIADGDAENAVVSWIHFSLWVSSKGRRRWFSALGMLCSQCRVLLSVGLQNGGGHFGPAICRFGYIFARFVAQVSATPSSAEGEENADGPFSALGDQIEIISPACPQSVLATVRFDRWPPIGCTSGENQIAFAGDPRTADPFRCTCSIQFAQCTITRRATFGIRLDRVNALRISSRSKGTFQSRRVRISLGWAGSRGGGLSRRVA